MSIEEKVQKIVCESIIRPSGSDLAEGAASLRPVPIEDLLDHNR